MPRTIDITGERQGRLVAVKCVGKSMQGRMWECRCDCGNTIIMPAGEFRTGKRKSCGCYNREVHTKHGLCKNPQISKIFDRFHMIKERTTNPSCSRYKDYGGRGIRLWPVWEKIPALFVAYVLRLGWNPELTIDRIDNNRGYEPGNIRLVSYAIQNRNKRSNLRVTLDGEEMVVTDAAKKLGIPFTRFQYLFHKYGPLKAVLKAERIVL